MIIAETVALEAILTVVVGDGAVVQAWDPWHGMGLPSRLREEKDVQPPPTDIITRCLPEAGGGEGGMWRGRGGSASGYISQPSHTLLYSRGTGDRRHEFYLKVPLGMGCRTICSQNQGIA